jgi:alpha-ketoglutarate-dependent taurine dioxygenase
VRERIDQRSSVLASAAHFEMPPATPRARRLAKLSSQLAPPAGLQTDAEVEADGFFQGVDMAGALRALAILRDYQGRAFDRAAAPEVADVAQGVTEMRDPGLPKAGRFVGVEVDASRGLGGFAAAELGALRSKLFARGALLLRGLPVDTGEAGVELSAFLRHFGEPRAEYWSKPPGQHWHTRLPVGTIQRFANDGAGTVLKGARAGSEWAYAWHFDGEFNPWWTSHTSMFCEAAPFAGHSTGYASQRAAYLAAACACPELVARLRGMRTLATIEGINIGAGNPGYIDLGLSREVQLAQAEGRAHADYSRKADEDDKPGGNSYGENPMSPAKYPAQHKPLLRRHYAAGYECLSGILGYLPEFSRYWQTRPLVDVVAAGGSRLGPDRAAALLQALLDFVTQDAFQYFHEWRPGDLVIWDNLACLHTVVPWDYSNAAGDQRRVMWRQTIGVDDDQSAADGRQDRTTCPPFVS